jgi:LacI family transcriptional regulator
MANIKDVALKAGVSTATVSYVLNNTRSISDEVRKRVRKAAEELDYQPSTLARSLRKNKTFTIGIIIPDNTNPYFADILRGMEDAFFKSGYSVFLCNSDRNVEKETQYLEALVNRNVDGIALIPSETDTKESIRLRQLKKPLVIVDRVLPDFSSSVIQMDNVAGAYDAVKYLCQLGHKRIACLAGPRDVPTSQQRVEGYKKALEESGISVDTELVFYGDFQIESGIRFFPVIRSLPQKPTAIFSCNDLMAIGLLKAARNAGCRIPEDCSIIGYDDILISSHVTPSLTTMAQPRYEMGHTAAEMLISKIADPSAPERKILKARLVIRESCAEPASQF